MSDKKDSGEQKPQKMAAWKKLLLAFSIVLMLGGLAVRGYGYFRGIDDPSAAAAATTDDPTPRTTGMPRGFLPRQDTPAEPAPAPTAAPALDTESALVHTWSPLVFQLGFGFFAGFCIAYAIHAFLKITLIAVGVFLLALLGLHYGGVFEIDWNAIARAYESVAAWVGVHFSGFAEFVASHLPSAATSILGLLAGFRRN